MKSITVLLASIAQTAWRYREIMSVTADDKQAIKNKVEFHRKRDRKK